MKGCKVQNNFYCQLGISTGHPGKINKNKQKKLFVQIIALWPDSVLWAQTAVELDDRKRQQNWCRLTPWKNLTTWQRDKSKLSKSYAHTGKACIKSQRVDKLDPGKTSQARTTGQTWSCVSINAASKCSKHMWEPRASLIKQSVGQCSIFIYSSGFVF